MELLNRAQDVLRRAESDLRLILADAAGRGQYDALATIASLAHQVAQMLPAEAGPQGNTAVPEQLQRSLATDISAEAASSSLRVPAKRHVTKARGKAKSRKATGSSRGYPQFFRHRDDLVKVGWSKRERKEYFHRAPRRACDSVVAALAKLSQNGGLIRSDDFMPLADRDGAEIPEYQAYVCLAWLKHEKLILPRGRQGYTVSQPDLAAQIEERWAKLSTK